jgi:Cd2+/Zn2+-exporting ATPase
MGDDIEKLPYLFHLSRVARQVLRQNVFASILLKASLAVGVFPGWVSLITAVLVGDMGASLGVTANALRLARVNGAGRRWGRTLRGSETPAPLPEHAGRA